MTTPPSMPVLPVPPNLPRLRSRLARWLGRTALRLGGWRMSGALPDVSKAVLIGAPHSSNWDGVWGVATKLALGLDVKILGKHQLFWWPLSLLLRRLGIIAVNRGAAHGVVEQLAKRFAESERFWLGIAPEGTRKPVERWKPGFWKIAKAAHVPVVPAYFNYRDKIVGIGPAYTLSDDMATDIAALRSWYRGVSKGKRHDV